MRSFLALLALAPVLAQSPAPLRPPATPLIAHDPYFSVWSAADQVNQQVTRHWTGSEQPITGLLRIDGKVRRFLGGVLRWAGPIAPMKQVRRDLTPTRTIYAFEDEGVRLELTFLTPALPDDLEVLARPVTYLLFDLKSTDGRPHQVKLYLDATSALAVNTTQQRAMWSRHTVGGLDVIRLGSLEQNVLPRSGDDLRIEWGYFYIAAPREGKLETLGSTARARALYVSTLDLPESHDLDLPAQTDRDVPVAAAAYEFEAPAAGSVARHLILAYDDLWSIEYFHRKLRPYWRRKGMGAEGLLKTAAADLPRLRERCLRFDAELTADLVRAGGPKYAALAILAYRQTLAAHKLAADFDGSPLYFSKENFSNGCIATVDVTYPSAPFFLLFNPRLLEAQLRPVLDYARSGRWPWPYAPHDLGQYPLANGQVYGGGEESEERQMPVEESGNMLILLGALAKIQGNAEFSRPYWPVLTRWAEYLREKGLDPENQLSTDDFAGHLAHNTNLSIKAIAGLAGYGNLAAALGHEQAAAQYRGLAKELAKKWAAMAADGDHYRLAFDKPGTWSQKYNLVWDKLLGLGLFAPEIARKEIAYYKTKQKPFGLPLDNRADYTKLDWIVWTATLAANQQDFAAIADPAFRFANETTDRVPLSDWYWTTDGRQRGFQARSVVGGVFIKMLEDQQVWKKWAAR
ncbi:MAG: glutaminase domain-containing protein [Bryobacteraceae bacterium]